MEILEGLSHLTAAQIYEALSFYHDHQAEIERDIYKNQAQRAIAHHGFKITPEGRLCKNFSD